MFVRVLSPLWVLVIACVLTRSWCWKTSVRKPKPCCGDLKAAVDRLQESVKQLQHQVASLENATCCNYELLVTTGTGYDADMDHSKIYVQLYDGHLATGWLRITTPADDFERGSTDKFPLKDKCLIDPCVRLKTVLMPRHPRDWWYCTKVQLNVLDCRSKLARVYHYTFNVGFVDDVESRCPQ